MSSFRNGGDTIAEKIERYDVGRLRDIGKPIQGIKSLLPAIRRKEKQDKIRYNTGSQVENQAIANDIYKRDCALIEEAAIRANPEIWRYILKSVTLGLSYEFIEYDDEQGKIPMCRRDFYGTRKKFYAILNDLKLDHKLTDIP